MLTSSERRGLSLLVLVLALGAARDLWIAHRLGRGEPGPPMPPPGAGVGSAPAPGDPPGPAAEHVPPATPAVAGPPLDLNRASAAELDALPGIGPVLAERILEHRRRHGPFRSADELLAVPGIGPRVLGRLVARVRAGPVPDSAGAAGAPAGPAPAAP